MNTAVDPFDTADQANLRSDEYFGKVECSAQWVVLRKGEGKAIYTERLHQLDERRTELAIVINPIDAMGLRFNVERNIIAESREWTNIVWPSLRDLGLKSARELNGKWCRAQLVDAGRKWTDRNGQERTQTTIRFTALYGSQAECVAAYESKDKAASASGGPPTNGKVNSGERDAALAFVETLVGQTKGDKALLAQLIAGMPMINGYFSIDSPEVVALLAKI